MNSLRYKLTNLLQLFANFQLRMSLCRKDEHFQDSNLKKADRNNSFQL